MNKTDQANKKRILDELHKNSRASASTIAEKTGLSRQTVAKTISDMEKEKTIWGYNTVANIEENGFRHFVLIVKRSMETLDTDRKNEVIFTNLDDYVPGELKIDDIFITHGMHDVVVTFYAKDILSARKLIKEISSRFNKYFKEYILLETLFPIQKQGFKNPKIEKLVEYI